MQSNNTQDEIEDTGTQTSQNDLSGADTGNSGGGQSGGDRVVDATPHLGGTGAGDRGGIEPVAPIVNEDRSDQTDDSSSDEQQ